MEKFKVGQTYPQNETALRIIAIQGNQALLEQWRNDELFQYIVTSGLFMYEGELHWHGSGAYFSCKYPSSICDTPYDALRKAVEYMQGPRMVYVVIADTDYGTSVSVKPTMAAAKAALQVMLDNNDDIRDAAASCGIEKITADAYLNGAISDAPGLMDWYGIEAQEVDFLAGGEM